MTVNLVTASKDSTSPDYSNIACQVRLDFRRASVTINAIVEGENRPPKDEGTDPDELFSGKYCKHTSSPRLLLLILLYQMLGWTNRTYLPVTGAVSLTSFKSQNLRTIATAAVKPRQYLISPMCLYFHQYHSPLKPDGSNVHITAWWQTSLPLFR